MPGAEVTDSHAMQVLMYKHAKLIHYLVRCPVCKARRTRINCRTCEGAGKVTPEVSEKLSIDRQES